MYVFEPGHKGAGMKVREGDQVVIPAGTVQMSLDPRKCTGLLYRPALPFLARKLFFEGWCKQPDDLADSLDAYEGFADSVLEKSPFLADLDIHDPADAEEARARIEAHRDSTEWWAWALRGALGAVREAIAQSDAQGAAYAMGLASNARAMCIFRREMERPIWAAHRMTAELRMLLNKWRANQSNSDEAFWHDLLSGNMLALCQLFSCPVVLLDSKAYVGGTGVDGKGGNYADLLLQNKLTGNVAILELKTPVSPLLQKTKYRGVYPPDRELAGAVIQTTSYVDSITKRYDSLAASSESPFGVVNPIGIVVAGKLSSLDADPERLKSLYLFRSQLRDIHVVTFDELFLKAKQLLDLLSPAKATEAEAPHDAGEPARDPSAGT